MVMHGTTGTLTIQGISWRYQRYCGKVAFCHGKHCIVYNSNSGYYQIKEAGETIFAARSVTECLENAAEYVWEYHASKLTPSWN